MERKKGKDGKKELLEVIILAQHDTGFQGLGEGLLLVQSTP